jgi:hypothetical protein
VASQQPTSARVRAVGPETGGVMLIIAGLAFILERFGHFSLFGADIHIEEVWRWLPLFAVYLGARELRDPAPGRQRTVLPLLAGVWLLISAVQVFGANFLNSWPLLVVLVGLGLIVDSIINGEPDAARLAQED